ncbi:M3 family metallopeptidase [Psychrosphaera sp. B3R10]|uniref:M3 family metallopeptidase n=1 Tax=unclassified Psychrosphaera TaxID=2641570 RepID=UPI001C088E16|nr:MULTISPECIES: M3 family metallopeptidase [unclassified Psychrosphaera]MBU2880887.1 M3 family metallopeptidase [Psychrosphaera sp. I2R16]MBU2990894.1 M3 family metallopeptidase [Psychrosphaera sp. B3R10]MDO6720590.1 M3 family metallopeptidase [Psychrosphaera sp. 1_MG-2023]
MKKSIKLAVAVALLGGLTACGGSDVKSPVAEVSAAQNTTNTILKPWTGPFEGVPAFDTVKLDDLIPAFKIAMKSHLAEVEAIANNKAPATFENTIVALEAVGEDLDRVWTYYGIWRSNMSSPEVREVGKELSPLISKHYSQISQNETLFARIKAVYESKEMKTLRKDQQRLVENSYKGLVRSGAKLSAEDKERFAAINLALAELHTNFGNNVLADEENYVTYLNESQLGGLPQSVITAAASAAAALGKEGQYAITNTRSSMDPFLTYSDERELRKEVWNKYYSRGDNGDEFDNNKNIAEILKLRHERVQLLGYKNYAEWRLEDRMAKNPENAFNLMNAVWPAAIARVKEEVADMQAVADAEKANIKIEPWDYRFYAEKVRKAKYDLDSDEVKQYLQLDNLREAMFYVAGKLFDFKFDAVKEGSVPVFHEDVKVWEVTKLSTGEHVGVWYLDPYARKGKRSGAWATSYRSFTTFQGKTNVLASNNSNFIKGEAGKPTLISWSDAETLFHEFGHALHSLSSQVEYPSQNGGVRDYTEFQSQLLERWLTTDPVIDNYLTHQKTGKPIPADLVAKIKKAATFNEGFKTTEYLASAIIDLKLHSMDPAGLDADKFERETLAEMGMPSELVMRHRTPHFGHIFSGEGYSAGYYGYMWAEVLTSDAAEAFEGSPGGYYDKGMAKKLVDHLFSVRNAIDPAEAYRLFRGRDAKVEALMRDRGFPVPK